MKYKTLGRRPTMGEVLDYYTRPDFLAFMLRLLQMYRVVTVISKQMHWEPDWARDEVRAEGLDDLERVIVDKIRAALPEMSPDEIPAYYPSFHMSVDRRGSLGIQDCVFETDLPTWRDSFRDVGAIAALLDENGVRYRQKFSGHRSLHMVIPGEIIPSEYRGKAAHKLVRQLLSWSASQAHRLPKITRMPYSLNEDTGLVCLPIHRGSRSFFRPWHACMHLVEVQDDWFEPGDVRDSERLVDLLEVLDSHTPCRPGGSLFDRERVRSFYLPRLQGLTGAKPERAYRLLSGLDPVSERCLFDEQVMGEAESAWLTVEAYLMHGDVLSTEAFDTLLVQGEEYAKSAAVDVIMRFEDQVLGYVLDALGDLGSYSAKSSRAAYLLTQSDSLRERAIDEIAARSGDGHEARIAAACLSGAMTWDWDGALRLLEPLRKGELSAGERIRLEAIDQMRYMGGWNKKEGAVRAAELAKLGTEITDLLLICAGSPFPRFRRDVVSTLTHLSDPQAVDLLIQALSDGYTKVRQNAVKALVRIGDPAVDALVQATASDVVLIRRNAVRCLGVIGAERGKAAILEALNDGEEPVRRQALRALKGVVTAQDADLLRSFLQEASWQNACEIAEAIEALGEDGISLAGALAVEERNLVSAYILGRSGDARGADLLAERLSEGGAVEETAAELLRELKDPRCVPFFGRMLDTYTEWRGAYIAHEMARIGTPESIAVAVVALSSTNHHMRRGAVNGLGELLDPETIPNLIGCLDDEDGKVRSLAAKALIRFGATAVEPVNAALAQSIELGDRRRNQLHYILQKLREEVQERYL